MNKTPDRETQKNNRTAFIMAEFLVLGFMAFRINVAVDMHSQRPLFLIALAGVALAMLVIAVIHLLNRFLDESFFIPMALYTIYILGSLLMKSFIFFFPISLVICCHAALFLNHRSLRRYIIFSNIISMVLVFFNIPILNPSRTVGMSEVLLQWFISLGGSLFTYLVSSVAVDKNNSANRARNSFLSLLWATKNPIVLLDSMNRVMYYSVPFVEMNKIVLPSMSIIVGVPVMDLIKNFNLKLLFHELLSQQGPYMGTKEVLMDGKMYYYDVSVSQLPGDFNGRLVHLINVTAMMNARFEAEAASQSKSVFLATMSHEIRTPLNAIIGLSEIELQKRLPIETRSDIEKIRNSGTSLLGIINDILDISKIEAGNFELIPMDYDLPSIINDTAQLNVVRIGSKRIEFGLSVDATLPTKVLGDELRIKQILNNILSNAIKYTEEGQVLFQITWKKQENMALLIFSVSDTGRGIKKEDIPRLFSEYSQLDAEANRYIEGTGLGLSITKNLVSMMNGTIEVESEYGSGSVFTVQIPQEIIDGSPIGELTARNLESLRFRDTQNDHNLRLVRSYMPYGRVLVVDDVETNLDVARGLLLPYGLAIEFARSGLEAITKVRDLAENPDVPRYDLILMDHMMPGMDGVEAVQIIRTEIDNDYARTVPIIALTANALAGNEEMFLLNGFNAYVSKPIDVMQLDVVLNTWIRNKQSKETLQQAASEQSPTDTTNAGPGLLDNERIDGIDLAKGRERYSTESAYIEILRSYVVHTPIILKKLWDPSPQTLSDYKVAVHGLKGSSYGICAMEIGEKAEKLEKAAKDGDMELVLAENGPFIEKVERLITSLGNLLKKIGGSKTNKQKAAAPDAALLAKLLDAAKRYKSTVMEEIMTEMESFEYESGSELIVWLRSQLDNLEYDSIQTQLEAMEPLMFPPQQEV